MITDSGEAIALRAGLQRIANALPDDDTYDNWAEEVAREVLAQLKITKEHVQ